MRFAEFYHGATGAGELPKGALIPACGSDSVLILDGRHGLSRSASIAREVCRKRGFLGFSIHTGESFTRSHMIRKLEPVE